MQQPVHAANIDEGSIIREATDRATHRLACDDLGIAPLLYLPFLLFGDGAAIHHDIFLIDVELSNAAANFLPHQTLHLGSVACSAARSRHECSYSHINA